jgi:small-conductance mechanosensitive channel
MGDVVRLIGPERAVEVLGVRLVGVNAENGLKLVFTILFILLVLLAARLLRAAVLLLLRHRRTEQTVFWTRQAVRLTTFIVVMLGLVSIWFDDPVRLATGIGLVSAGLAFALQKVVTALAGYAIILNGKTFGVGDRIRMGGVRGDVIGLGFMQTTIMEMGQPPPVQGDEPAMWVQSRQYTGRVVAVSNATIFDEPVYNYTREFPYLWEELSLPVPYGADRARAERILLDVADRHTVPLREVGEEALVDLERRYFTQRSSLEPRVFYRLTDNWLELTVRFIARDRGIRELKDGISRDVLAALEDAGIGVASATMVLSEGSTLRLAIGGADGRARAVAAEADGS